MAANAVATVPTLSGTVTDYSYAFDLSDFPADWWNTIDTADPTRGRSFKADDTTRLACDWIGFVNNGDGTGSGALIIKYSGNSSGGEEIHIEPPVSTNSTVAVGDTYGQHNAHGANCLEYWSMHESATPLYGRLGNVNIAATGAGLSFAQSGALGKSIYNDGSDPYMSAAINLSGENRIVVEALFNWDAFANDDDLLCEYTPNLVSNIGGFFIDPNDAAGVFALALRGTGGWSVARYSRPSAAAWHHVAGDFDMTLTADEVSMYMDGSLQTPSSRPLNSNNSGYNFANSTLYFLGRNNTSLEAAAALQHFSLYSERTADEIATDSDMYLDNSTFWGTIAWVGSTNISGQADGSATVSGTITGIGAISGQSDGSSVVSGSLSGIGFISGTVHGSAVVSATLSGIGSIVGQADGQTTIIGTISGLGKIAGQADGIATITGTIQNASPSGNISGFAAGSCSVVGTLKGLGAITGEADGEATVVGTLSGIGAISGLAEGSTTLTGTIYDGANTPVGEITISFTRSLPHIECTPGNPYISVESKRPSIQFVR